MTLKMISQKRMRLKKKLKFYLSHSFESRHEVRKIELCLERDFNVELYNPFYDSVERQDILKVDEGIEREDILYNLTLEQCSEIVNRDLKAIDKYGMLLVYIIGSVGFGTAMEIGYAISTGRLLVIVTDAYYNHPWARHYAHFLFKDISELEDFLRTYEAHPWKLRLMKFKKNAYARILFIQYLIVHCATGIRSLFRRLKKHKNRTVRIRETIKKLKKTDEAEYNEVMKNFRGRGL